MYLRRIGDFRGYTRTLRLLRKTSELAVPLGLIDEAENKLKDLILTEGNIVLKFRADRGIYTEYVECN